MKGPLNLAIWSSQVETVFAFGINHKHIHNILTDQTTTQKVATSTSIFSYNVKEEKASQPAKNILLVLRGKKYAYLNGSPLISIGDMFQDPQWTPETVGSAEPYVYYFFSYVSCSVT